MQQIQITFKYTFKYTCNYIYIYIYNSSPQTNVKRIQISNETLYYYQQQQAHTNKKSAYKRLHVSKLSIYVNSDKLLVWWFLFILTNYKQYNQNKK